jgi:hypothetical protein
MSSPVEVRRSELLELAKHAGIRLKNVPEHPSQTWLDKAERKVKEAIAKREETARARREALVQRAARAGIKLRNVPELPSRTWLKKAEAKVGAIIAERLARDVQNPRLASLLARASKLSVRLRSVPDAPSDAWLDKLEEKLTTIGRSRNTPEPIDPTEPLLRVERRPDPAATLEELPPVPMTEPAAIDAEAQERRAVGDRVAELVSRAERAGLDLGRVPPNPNEEWVVSTAAALESILDQRREARRKERSHKAAQRKERMRTLFALADRHQVLIDHVPSFPTEEWISRIELMVHERAYAHEDDSQRRDRIRDQQRRERLTALLARAERGGFDIGTIPPDPGEEWLTEAEQRVVWREAEASEVLEADDMTLSDTAQLLYEEGTLQQEAHPLDPTDENLTIGRNRSNAIQVRNDSQVSRRHARLWMLDDTWYVADLGSTRGTQVNEQICDGKHPLCDGDEIRVGETRFVFRG